MAEARAPAVPVGAVFGSQMMKSHRGLRAHTGKAVQTLAALLAASPRDADEVLAWLDNVDADISARLVDTGDARRMFVDDAQLQSYAAGDVIVEEGDISDGYYYIISGDCEVIKECPDETVESHLSRSLELARGKIIYGRVVGKVPCKSGFGELGLLSEQRQLPRAESVVAIEETVCLFTSSIIFSVVMTTSIGSVLGDKLKWLDGCILFRHLGLQTKYALAQGMLPLDVAANREITTRSCVALVVSGEVSVRCEAVEEGGAIVKFEVAKVGAGDVVGLGPVFDEPKKPGRLATEESERRLVTRAFAATPCAVYAVEVHRLKELCADDARTRALVDVLVTRRKVWESMRREQATSHTGVRIEITWQTMQISQYGLETLEPANPQAPPQARFRRRPSQGLLSTRARSMPSARRILAVVHAAADLAAEQANTEPANDAGAEAEAADDTQRRITEEGSEEDDGRRAEPRQNEDEDGRRAEPRQNEPRRTSLLSDLDALLADDGAATAAPRPGYMRPPGHRAQSQTSSRSLYVKGARTASLPDATAADEAPAAGPGKGSPVMLARGASPRPADVAWRLTAGAQNGRNRRQTFDADDGAAADAFATLGEAQRPSAGTVEVDADDGAARASPPGALPNVAGAAPRDDADAELSRASSTASLGAVVDAESAARSWLEAAAVDATHNVLVVDDSATTRNILSHVFRKSQCRVTESHDGADALRKMTAQRYAIVVMDMVMPLMDGATALEHLRAHERAGRAPMQPVMLLTSLHPNEPIVQRALAAKRVAIKHKSSRLSGDVLALVTECCDTRPPPPL
ncbi:hypothetical protein M885DRAFT_547689 [Pelagophyceae sp. CCMP2097]|nr:hypothetical protein M885DRAFT_547689 [Pelagophyceae sp. CCMP2097]